MNQELIVVDQNVLRKSLLERHIVDHPDAIYVLPDLGFLEMTQSTEWENTTKRSLRILAEVPTRVLVCSAVAEALRFELNHVQSFEGRWIDTDATEFVRDLLHSVRTGVDGKSIIAMRANIDSNRAELARDYFDHDATKRGLQELIDVSKEMVHPAMLKAMRGARATREERLRLLQETNARLAPAVLSSSGFNETEIQDFLAKRPLVLRYLYLRLWQSMHWLEYGGHENRSPRSVTNDELDLQYILPATFLDGVLSEERIVKEVYDDLMELLAC